MTQLGSRGPPAWGLPPYPPPMADEKPRLQGLPQPPAAAARARERRSGDGLAELRAPDAPDRERPDYEVHRPAAAARGCRPCRGARRARRRAAPPDHAPAASLKWLALALFAWVALSAVLFMVSAQIQRGDLASEVGAQLDPGPYPLTGANTILVLGSDARTEGLAEPGSGGPSRSDSIMLLRIGGGANASLSIPRDTVVDIPGHGTNKINAAYAFGGPALATQTVKDFLGDRDQPRRRGELRELPAADRRARRRHLQGRRRALEDQRRPRERRHHAAA